MVKEGQRLIKCRGAVVALAMTNGRRNLVTALENGGVWIWDIEANWLWPMSLE